MLNPEIIGNIIAGFVCLIAGGVLLLRERRNNYHLPFALSILFFSAATILRGFNWFYNIPLLYQIGYIGFILSPTFFLIFIENFTKLRVPIWIKGVALLGCLILIPSAFYESFFKSLAWKFAVVSYHLCLSTYALWALIKIISLSRTQREKAIALSMSVTFAASYLLFLSDIMSQVFASSFRSGSLPLCILTFGFTRAFNSEGEYSLKSDAYDLIGGIVLTVAAAVALPYMITGATFKSSLIAIITIYLGRQVIRVLRQCFYTTNSHSRLLQRLNKLPKSSTSVFLNALSNFEEIEQVQIIPSQFFYDLKLAELIYTPSVHERVLHPHFIAHNDHIPDFKDKLQMLAFSSGNDYFYFINKSVGYLGLSFTHLLNDRYVHELIEVVGSFARLLPADSEEAQTLKLSARATSEGVFQ